MQPTEGNPVRRRARSALSRSARAVPSGLRRRLVRGPGAAVLVSATDRQAPYLDECLDSLRGQTHRALQVVVAPYDECAAAVEAARRHARQDWRVEVLRPSPTRAAALDAAVAATSSPFLAFASAADTLPPRAVEVLVGSLATSGADFAVGDLTLAAPFRHLVRPEHRQVHERTVLRLDLASCPRAVRDLHLHNRMFRRSFWESSGLHFPEHGLDDVLMARAYLSATAFDLRSEVTYHAQQRGDGITFGTVLPQMPVLEPWLAEQRRLLAEAAARSRTDAYLVGLLDSQLVRFLDDCERADASQWRDLAAFAATCRDSVTPGGLRQVRPESRVKSLLAAQDRREDLARFVSRRWQDEREHATTVRDGRVFAELPVPDGVPEDELEMADEDLRPVLTLHRMRWVGRRLMLEVLGYVDEVDQQSAWPALDVALVSSDGSRLPCPDVEQHEDPEVTLVAGQRHHAYDRGAFSALLPEVGEGVWSLEVAMTASGVRRTSGLTHRDGRGSAAVPRPREDGALEALARVDPAGAVRLELRRPPAGRDSTAAFRISGVEPMEHGVVLHGRCRTAEDDPGTLVLAGPAARAPAHVSERAGSAFTVTFDLREAPWGGDPRPLPTGVLTLEAPGGAEPDATLLDALPLRLLGDRHRFLVTRTAAGTLTFQLAAPLARDEVGPFAQTSLRSWYRGLDEPVREDLVYLQSYLGGSATDSQLEIFHELRRRRPDLTVRWGVADMASWVPEGAAPVLLGSRDHYRVMATAGLVCANIELEAWFRRRPGQRYLQTFHGYPSKAMGVPQWLAKNFTPLRVEQHLDASSRNWDLALTPTPEMDRFYRETYCYEGEILHVGYPRNDPLVAPSAAHTRARTRALLGIEDGQTAVLYAPTWRDDLATAFRAAKMPGDFDVDEVAAALGEQCVLLVRGHRFHGEQSSDRPNVVDVTSYPQINDLILAADAAVLDYSSLRFDFALTGRPMVFHVPDLADYTGGVRGFLMDFRETAPGPLLTTQEEVVAALRRLPDVEQEHAADYATFNARFNPLHDGHAAERVVDQLFAS